MRRVGMLLVLGLLFACETRVELAQLTPCSSENCAGCCSFGVCVALGTQDKDHCGVGGATCGTCDGRCVQGQCKAASTCGVCDGCCSGPFCNDGASPVACGSGGDQCVACNIDEECVGQKCTKCTAANCAGCCDVGGLCRAGDVDVSCGSAGVTCAPCAPNTHCSGGVCR